MSEKLYEQLSQLLDDELPEEELDLLLKQIDNSPELLDKFSRYSLIQSTIQSTMHESSSQLVSEKINDISMPSILDKVREGIADDEPDQQAVASLNSWRTRKKLVQKVVKPFFGAAIAASVAAISVILVTSGNVSDTPNSISLPATASNSQTTLDNQNNVVDIAKINRSRANSGIQTVSLSSDNNKNKTKNKTNSPTVDVNEMQWESMSPELRKKINNYIAKHRQYPAGTSLNQNQIRTVTQKASGE